MRADESVLLVNVKSMPGPDDEAWPCYYTDFPFRLPAGCRALAENRPDPYLVGKAWWDLVRPLFEEVRRA